MTIKILVTPVLRPFTGNRKSIEVEGATVRDCLNRFVALYPGTENWIFANPKAPMISVFVNKEAVFPDNLDREINDRDVIDLTPVVAGG